MTIPYEEIDLKCRDMVRLFNENNLSTIGSCQGHDNIMQNSFYIIFAEYVIDKDIYNFLSIFDKHTTHTPFVGIFKKWMRKYCGTIVSNWSYSVEYGKYKVNQKLALIDYETMKNKLDEVNK